MQYDFDPTTPQEGEAGLVQHPAVDYLRQGNLFIQDNQKKGEEKQTKVFQLIWLCKSILSRAYIVNNELAPCLLCHSSYPVAQVLWSIQEKAHWREESSSDQVYTHWSPRTRTWATTYKPVLSLVPIAVLSIIFILAACGCLFDSVLFFLSSGLATQSGLYGGERVCSHKDRRLWQKILFWLGSHFSRFSSWWNVCYSSPQVHIHSVTIAIALACMFYTHTYTIYKLIIFKANNNYLGLYLVGVTPPSSEQHTWINRAVIETCVLWWRVGPFSDDWNFKQESLKPLSLAN